MILTSFIGITTTWQFEDICTVPLRNWAASSAIFLHGASLIDQCIPKTHIPLAPVKIFESTVYRLLRWYASTATFFCRGISLVKCWRHILSTILGYQTANLVMKNNNANLGEPRLNLAKVKRLSWEKVFKHRVMILSKTLSASAHKWRGKERKKKVIRRFVVGLTLSLAVNRINIWNSSRKGEESQESKHPSFLGNRKFVCVDAWHVLYRCSLSQYQYQSWNCYIIALLLSTKIFLHHILYGLMLGNHFQGLIKLLWFILKICGLGSITIIL